jgi:hypothetical protein
MLSKIRLVKNFTIYCHQFLYSVVFLGKYMDTKPKRFPFRGKGVSLRVPLFEEFSSSQGFPDHEAMSSTS